MKSFSDLKATARQTLLGHYGLLIGAKLVVSILFGLIETPFSRMIQEGIYYDRLFRIIWGYVGLIFISLITDLFGVGLIYMQLKIARKKGIQFSDLLHAFRSTPNKFIGITIVTILIDFVCTLPGAILVVLGSLNIKTFSLLSGTFFVLIGAAVLIIGVIILIILNLALSLSPYLLIDHPEYGVMGTLRESMRLMRRKKGRLFVLYLSFIGWYLLGLVTLGIGMFWIQPYVHQTRTQFYLDAVAADSGQEQ